VTSVRAKEVINWISVVVVLWAHEVVFDSAGARTTDVQQGVGCLVSVPATYIVDVLCVRSLSSIWSVKSITWLILINIKISITTQEVASRFGISVSPCGVTSPQVVVNTNGCSTLLASAITSVLVHGISVRVVASQVTLLNKGGRTVWLRWIALHNTIAALRPARAWAPQISASVVHALPLVLNYASA